MTTTNPSELDGMLPPESGDLGVNGMADPTIPADYMVPDLTDPNSPPFAGNIFDPRFNHSAITDVQRRMPRSTSQLMDIADNISVKSGLVGLTPRNLDDLENRLSETMAELVNVKPLDTGFYFAPGAAGSESVSSSTLEPDFYFMPSYDQAELPAELDLPTPPELPELVKHLPIGLPTGYDVNAIRQDFPILHQKVNGQPLVWFDNAATTQKPSSVINTLSHFYENDNSNIHRGAHTLAARSTDAYEEARKKVQKFLGAADASEIIFVRGTTEGINLVANSYGQQLIEPGDEILLTTLEHHSNILPWQALARRKGAVLRVVPINDHGEIMLDEYSKLLGPNTKMVALSQVSNALGTVVPVHEMVEMAHQHGACVLIDGAQAVSHMPVNVQDIGADFYVFSGHKLFGPTGIGALYGRRELLETMPPWQGGGGMIDKVTFEQSTFAQPPAKFEAGTGSIADAVGLGSAIDYVTHLGRGNIEHYERGMTTYLMEQLARVRQLRLIGTAVDKVSVVSFVVPGKRAEDIGRYLDQMGIAVRAGHHCAQPTMKRFGVDSTVRASLAFYNTYAEIDKLIKAIRQILQ